MADMSNFFDKVKESAASAAAATGKAVKGASNSAKKMAETAKLKHEISGLEDKTAGVFREIGELFYTRSKGEADEAYAELFAKVAETRKEIEQKQAELSQLENSATCPACGKRVKSSAVFCSYCGAKVKQEEPAEESVAETPDKSYCPACGVETVADAVFCPACGARMTPAEDVVDVPKEDVTVEPAKE